MKDISKDKQAKRSLRHGRVRSRVSGTAVRPRLSVFRSAKAIYAQLIDDTIGKTITSLHTRSLEKGTKTEKSLELGKRLAVAAKQLGITHVVFDRGGYMYHGRIKAVAEGAREAGLIF